MELASAVKSSRDFWQVIALVNSLVREGLLYVDEGGMRCSTRRQKGLDTFAEVLEKNMGGYCLDKD